MDINYNDSTNLLTASGLQNTATGRYIEDATVTATLLDAQGAAVGTVPAVTLSFVAGSAGVYQGTTAATFNVTPGTYTWKVVATDAQGNKRTKRASVQVSN